MARKAEANLSRALQDILDVAARLAAALEDAGKEINKEWFYYASYDPPFRCVL